MLRTGWLRILLSVAALLPAIPASGLETGLRSGTPAGEQVAVWLPDAHGAQGLTPPALLDIPPGWCIGDAAAVIAPDRAWPAALRARLVAALRASGAAVLELHEPRGGALRGAALRRDLSGALRTLHRIEGAGLIVVIGFGEGGDAALAAAEAADEDGRRYAAAVRLGPDAPLFRFNEAAEEEGWPLRAPLLCDLIAGVLEGGGQDVAASCRMSLASLS